jgi:hypothetical protein
MGEPLEIDNRKWIFSAQIGELDYHSEEERQTQGKNNELL